MILAVVIGFIGLWLGNWVARRIRFRILRFIILVPLLSVFALAVTYNVGNALNDTVNLVRSQIVEIVDTAVVQRGNLLVTVTGTGVIAPNKQALLSFQYAAPVKEILIVEGQDVNAGDVIARLDATELELALADARIALDFQQSSFEALTSPPRAIDVEAAEAQLTAAQANFGAATLTGPSVNDVEIARLQTEISRNQLWQTQLQRDQLENSTTIPLLEVEDIPPEISGPLTDEQLDDGLEIVNDAIDTFNDQQRAQTAMQRSQLEMGITQNEYGVQIADTNYQATLNRGPNLGSLSSANAQLTQSQIALERLLNGPTEFDLRRAEIDLEGAQLAYKRAESNLTQTILIAPFNGKIAQSNLVVGQFPSQQLPAVILVDDSRYYVDLPIDETDIVKLGIGQSVTFVVDALPDAQVTGEVVRVSLIPQRSGQLITYSARVELEPVIMPIRIGMSVTARINVLELNNVLLLPNKFIRIDRATGQSFVTIQDESKQYIEIPVTLGQRNEDISEIINGLDVNQQVFLLPRGTFIPSVGGGQGR